MYGTQTWVKSKSLESGDAQLAPWARGRLTPPWNAMTSTRESLGLRKSSSDDIRMKLKEMCILQWQRKEVRERSEVKKTTQKEEGFVCKRKKNFEEGDGQWWRFFKELEWNEDNEKDTRVPGKFSFCKMIRRGDRWQETEKWQRSEDTKSGRTVFLKRLEVKGRTEMT